MYNESRKSRRSFLKKAFGTAIISSTAPSLLSTSYSKIVALEQQGIHEKKYAAKDQVNIDIICMGIMGFANA